MERGRDDRGEDRKCLDILAEDRAAHVEKNESWKFQKLKRSTTGIGVKDVSYKA